MKVGSGTVLILNALQYELEDENTKKKRTGVSLEYVTGINEFVGKDGRQGCQAVKASIAFEEWANLSALPGWYTIDLMMTTETVTKGGQRQTIQSVKPANLKYVGALVTTPTGAAGTAGAGGAAK